MRGDARLSNAGRHDLFAVAPAQDGIQCVRRCTGLVSVMPHMERGTVDAMITTCRAARDQLDHLAFTLCCSSFCLVSCVCGCAFSLSSIPLPPRRRPFY